MIRKAREKRADKNPDNVSAGAFVFDARFLGQFLDAETGLFHYGFRDYDAKNGRYIESDPLGLEAGWNTYGYAEGGPTDGTDPFGLRKVVAYIWENESGHVMLSELDKTPLLNQYPQTPAYPFNAMPVAAKNANPLPSFEFPFGRNRNEKPSAYLIDIKNDAVFDALVDWNRNKANWNVFPGVLGRLDTTNCVDATTSALNGSGFNLDDRNLFGIQDPAALRKSLDKTSQDGTGRVIKIKGVGVK